MDRTPHILVVDDHREIRELIAKYLVKNGLRVSTANGGAEMRGALRGGSIDLIVLDIMMPGEDGLTLCRQIRQGSDVPIVLLTAVAEETDRVVGLELGADDYVTKPFNPRELLARIRAILRRAGAQSKPTESEAKRYRFGTWTVDTIRRVLIDGTGEESALGTAEFRLLTAFLARPGLTLSRDQLLDITVGRQAQIFDRSIDNLVSRLRRRIEPDPLEPSLIKTVWGEGYTFAGVVEVIE
ncbi:MAG: response regulator [Ancalomicrobiaceae bacterium]|nr:response regulator [Ancalomicrobiaceae bacterium]